MRPAHPPWRWPVILLVAAFVMKPLWHALDPRVAVTDRLQARSLDGVTPDPWGRAPIRGIVAADHVWYSAGPDGVDDRGEGDDVVACTNQHGVAAQLVLLWRWTSVGLALAALAVACLSSGLHVLQLRRRSALERASWAAVASVPAAVFVGVGVAVDPWARSVSTSEGLVVGDPLAVGLTVGFACVLAGTALLPRLVRQRPSVRRQASSAAGSAGGGGGAA